MVRTLLILCTAALAFGADDPWAKVKELKTGAELHVFQRGSAQPLVVKMDELTDDNLVVITKKGQMAIPREQVERIDARPSARTRTVTNTQTAEQNAATDPRSTIPGPNQPPGAVHASSTTTASGVTWTKQDFETIYYKTAASSRPAVKK